MLDGRVTALFSDPSRWTQKYYAKTESGMALKSPFGPDAYCFCLAGAIDRFYRDSTDNVRRIVLKKLNGVSIHSFNDENSYEAVLSLCKELNL